MRESSVRGDYKLPARERDDGRRIHRTTRQRHKAKWRRQSRRTQEHSTKSTCTTWRVFPSYAPLVMQSKLLVSALTLAFNSNRRQQRKRAQAPASCLLWEQEQRYDKEGTSRLVCACAGRRGGRAEDKRHHALSLLPRLESAAEEAAKRRLSHVM